MPELSVNGESYTLDSDPGSPLRRARRDGAGLSDQPFPRLSLKLFA